MEKFWGTLGRLVGFIILCLVGFWLISVKPINEPAFLLGHSGLTRLWWEFLPLLIIIIATVIFSLCLDRGSYKVILLNHGGWNAVLGIGTGLVWLGAVILVLALLNSFKIVGTNSVKYWYFYIIPCFLNVVMQEYLVRGYLFQLLRHRHGNVIAIVITTLFFVLLHGLNNLVTTLNLITMSILMCLLLIYSGSILVPILAHFVWNCVGGIVFGCVALADDYPSFFNTTITGLAGLSGNGTIESNLVTLWVNIIACCVFLILCLVRKRH